MSRYTCILASIGVVLSTYALYVEHRMSHPSMDADDEAEEFVALCDIDAIGASCSHVFTLPEGRLLSYLSIIPHDHLFDVPNAALGLTYYTVIFLLERIAATNKFMSQNFKLNITILFNTAAMSSSVFLAYKLLALGELCILCWSTHLINLLLLLHYVRRLFNAKRAAAANLNHKKMD